MVRKMLLVLVAASMLAGFTPPASAGDSSSSDEHDYSYVWEVKCNCEWDFKLAFYHHGKKVYYYETCNDHHPIYEYIKEPDYGKKITLDGELDYPGFESETEDTEKYFNGRFTVYHKISETCWFSSTVDEPKH